MSKIVNGRMTADLEGDFVVFLIGMRTNKPWKLHKWIPVARPMATMQRALQEHPELGCLAIRNWFGLTTLSVQYWRSFEHLDRFARDTELPHLEPWRKFNRRVRDSGDVGIWHETYQVKAGNYEAVYGNMPRFGLAEAGAHVPASVRGNSAAHRIGASEDDSPAVEVY